MAPEKLEQIQQSPFPAVAFALCQRGMQTFMVTGDPKAVEAAGGALASLPTGNSTTPDAWVEWRRRQTEVIPDAELLVEARRKISSFAFVADGDQWLLSTCVFYAGFGSRSILPLRLHDSARMSAALAASDPLVANVKEAAPDMYDETSYWHARAVLMRRASVLGC